MKHTLSPRQVQIMRRLCRGLVAKEIAEDLGISFHTVKAQMRRAKLRLHARNIVQAAALFVSAKSDSEVHYKHPPD